MCILRWRVRILHDVRARAREAAWAGRVYTAPTLETPMSLFRCVKSLVVALIVPTVALGLAGCPSGDDDDSAAEDGPVVVSGVGTFDTIQDGIDAAPECATVTIGAGIYEERLQIRRCVTIVGVGQDRVRVTGGGAGTMVDIDQASGPVLLSSFQVYGPFDEPGTIRGVRVTNTADVTLNDMFIGFEPGPNGELDNGNVGVDISQSTVVINDTDIVRVGFGSEVGGTGVQAQTNSSLTMEGSRVEGGGSFGVHAVGGSMYLKDTEIISTNRSTGAQQFEADGSGIWAEDFSEAVTLDNVTVQSGSFVGAWMDAPTVIVNGGSFSLFAYGVYLPGDQASAAGRRLTVTGTTFTDLAQLGVLGVASTTVTGSTFTASEGLPDPNNGRPYGAIRVVAPGGDVDISGNIVSGVGSSDAIRILGSSTDGPVATVNINGNTVQNVVAGNGIQVVEADAVSIDDNIISGIDHGYWIDAANPGNNGLIINGFGIACFQVNDCSTTNNSVTAAEFANLVIVNSVFSSTDDVLLGSVWQGVQVEGSQGTFDNLSVTDGEGNGGTFIDSTVAVDNSTFSGFFRGANFRDFDEFEDPLPEDILRFNGGEGLQNFSNGNPAWLQVTNSTFADNVDNALVSQDSQLIFTDNVLTNNGFEYDDGSGIILGPGSSLQVFRGDTNALTGPLIQNNIVDGGTGSWAVQINGAADTRFLDNIVCGGASAGLFFSGNAGGMVSGNQFGSSTDATVTSCDALEWTYQVYLAGSDATAVGDSVEISDNVLSNAVAQYGFFMSALGPFDIIDNDVVGGSIAGLRMAATLPNGLTGDNDGDGTAEYLGDCNDDDPTVWWNRNSQTGAAEVTDGVDNDCDGVTDAGIDTSDTDGDGVTIEDGDCDDNDPAVLPGATEIVGNLKDDDCALFDDGIDNNGDGIPDNRPSRWADFDGEMPVPVVTLEGNTFTGVGTGIDIDGAQVVLSDGANSDNPNTIDGATLSGVVVDDWMWSTTTPELVAGSLTVDAGTVLSAIAGDCFLVQGEGTTLTLGAVTLDGCGGSAVSMYAPGFVTATGTVIDGAGDDGIEVGDGVVLLDGVSITGVVDDGISAQGGQVTANNVTILNPGADGVAVAFSGASLGDVTLLGGSITGAGGNGAEITGGSLDLQGTTILASTLQSVLALGGTVTATAATITGGAVGVDVSGTADVTLTDTVISGTVGAGAVLGGGALTLTDGSISGAGAAGVTASGGTLTVDGTTIDTAVDDGIALTGTTVASVNDAALDTNTGFGLSCDGGLADPNASTVTLTPCTATPTSNGAGDFDLYNGCEVAWSCLVP